MKISLDREENLCNISVNFSNMLILLAQIVITKIFDRSVSLAFIKDVKIIDGLFCSDA